MRKIVILILMNGTHIKCIFAEKREVRNNEICMRKIRTDEVVYVTYSADLR